MWVSNASWLHICVLHLYSDNCIACSQSACNWRQTDVDPEDLKRWRERAQSANKLQFLMMSGKHVARGVTKPTGRKKGKCATMRTWTLGSSLMPMITCPPKYQINDFWFFSFASSVQELIEVLKYTYPRSCRARCVYTYRTWKSGRQRQCCCRSVDLIWDATRRKKNKNDGKPSHACRCSCMEFFIAFLWKSRQENPPPWHPCSRRLC